MCSSDLTRQRATARKIVGIRKEATEMAKGYFLENNASAIVAAILEGKFQSDLASRLGHIAQLNKIEVRKLEVTQA